MTSSDFEPTVAFDPLGDGFVAPLVEAMAPRGRIVSFGVSAGAEVTFNMQLLYRKAVSLLGYGGLHPHPRGAAPRPGGRPGGGARRRAQGPRSTRSSRSRTSTTPSGGSSTAACRASCCSTSAKGLTPAKADGVGATRQRAGGQPGGGSFWLKPTGARSLGVSG